MKVLIALVLVVAASSLFTAAPSRATVIITQNLITTETQVQGGGGATPVVLGPTIDSSNILLGSLVNNAIATGVQNAENGVGDIIGTASGTGIANGSTSVTGTTIGALLSASGSFSATGSGSGLGSGYTEIEILFTLTSATDYTFNGLLSNDFESPDTIVFEQLTGGILEPTNVALIVNVFPSIADKVGTLSPGTFRLYAHINAFESGGSGQSPSSETVNSSFSLEFVDGTSIVAVPEPSAGFLCTLGLVGLLISRTCRRSRTR